MSLPIRAPFVLKIKFVTSDRRNKTKVSRDGAHLRYIATRPGAELAVNERGQADDMTYARYVAARPGSTGLFGPEGPAELAAAMAEVSSRKHGVAWRVVLSLREDDARALGIVGAPRWQDLTRRAVAQFARAANVKPEHLRWYAAHHAEPGHPHVHIFVWLADGARTRRGALTRPELRVLRRGVAQEVYGPLRAELAAQKTAARQELVAAGRGLLTRRAELELQVADPVGMRLPPRFQRADLQELAAQVTRLAGKLPGHGRAALAYMPEATRAEARRVADWILSRPELAGVLADMERAVRDMTSLYSREAGAGDAAWRKARDDVRDRTAQAVVRVAAAEQKQEAAQSRGASLAARGLFKAAHRAIERERLRAEAKAQLASLQAAEEAEEKGRRERQRQMGGGWER